MGGMYITWAVSRLGLECGRMLGVMDSIRIAALALFYRPSIYLSILSHSVFPVERRYRMWSWHRVESAIGPGESDW